MQGIRPDSDMLPARPFQAASSLNSFLALYHTDIYHEVSSSTFSALKSSYKSIQICIRWMIYLAGLCDGLHAPIIDPVVIILLCLHPEVTLLVVNHSPFLHMPALLPLALSFLFPSAVIISRSRKYHFSWTVTTKRLLTGYVA